MGGRILTGEVNCSDIKVTTGLEVEGRTNHATVTEGTKDLDITINRKEYTIVGDDVYIPKLYDDAPQWLKDLVDVVVEVGVEANNADLLGQVQDLINQLANATVPLNTFTQSIIALNLEDARINTVVETLNSNFSDATSSINAQIIDVRNTFVSKDEAAATIANAISAEIDNGVLQNMATVGHVATALATETAARAADYTALESSIAGESEATATAINTINTYVGIDQAGASTGTGLSAYLVDSNGVVGGADSQVANAVYIDNGVPKSKWEYGSVINIGGVNYTSGFGLKTVGSASEFWIDASKLKFTNSAKTGTVAPFTIDASGTTPQVKFNGAVEFSNVNNVPSLGSNNMLVNAGPTLGNETYGWQIGWYNTNIAPTGPSAGFDSWRPTGGGSVYAVVGGSPTVGTVFDLKQSTNIPVVAGKRYEVSALLSSHRCTSVCTLAFFNSSGTYISESGAGTANSVAYSGAVGNWVRQGGFVTAPSGTAYAQFYVRSVVTSTDPYCFVAQAYMAEASASSTQFSTWGEGLSANSVINWQSQVQAAINNNATYIDGGKIVTNTLYGDRLVANSVDATKISSYSLTSTNATIQNGLITNAKIADAAITNAKIGDGAITNAKIGDAQITTAKIGTAQIDTLRIAGEAITANRFVEGVGTAANVYSASSISLYYAPSVTHSVVILFTADGSSQNNTFKLYLNGGLLFSKNVRNIGQVTYIVATTLYAGTGYTLSGEAYGDGYEGRVGNFNKQILMLGAKR